MNIDEMSRILYEQYQNITSNATAGILNDMFFNGSQCVNDQNNQDIIDLNFELISSEKE